jgi:hypothetical protein
MVVPFQPCNSGHTRLFVLSPLRSSSWLQQSLQHQQEVFFEHRLNKCCPYTASADLVHGYQAAMTSKKNHRNLASYPKELPSQFGASQCRHDLVHNYRVEPLRIPCKKAESIARIVAGYRQVTQMPQHLPEHLGDHSIVIDNENPRSPTPLFHHRIVRPAGIPAQSPVRLLSVSLTDGCAGKNLLQGKLRVVEPSPSTLGSRLADSRSCERRKGGDRCSPPVHPPF